MGNTAARIPAPIPVLTVIGNNAPLTPSVRKYFVDKLPANQKSQFIQVSGGHLDTPREANSQVIDWIKSAVLNA